MIVRSPCLRVVAVRRGGLPVLAGLQEKRDLAYKRLHRGILVGVGSVFVTKNPPTHELVFALRAVLRISAVSIQASGFLCRQGPGSDFGYRIVRDALTKLNKTASVKKDPG